MSWSSDFPPVALHVSVRLLPSRFPTGTFSAMTWTPFHFLIVAISGWMNREQQQVIDYLREENRILREKLGRKRIILNESQKLRLATAAMKLGKDLLQQRVRCSAPPRCYAGTAGSSPASTTAPPSAGPSPTRPVPSARRSSR